MAWRDTVWSRRIDATGKGLAVISIFSLPFSTTLFAVASSLSVLAWLATGDWAGKLFRIWENPVARYAIVFFGLLCLGGLYSSAGFEDVRAVLGKYSKLLYIPVVISILDQTEWRTRAYASFVVSMGFVLLLSYAKLLGLLPPDAFAEDYSIAKTHILHGVLMALLLYLLLSWALRHPRWRWPCVLGAVLTAYNLFFMTSGRTGWVVFFVLVGALCLQQWRWRGALVASLLAVTLVGSLYATSAVFEERVHLAVNEIHEFSSSVDRKSNASAEGGVSLRLEHYLNTLTLIARHPVFGGGTGSWKKEYAELVSGRETIKLSDAHNEYLMIATQLGLAGLVVYLVMLIRQWRATAALTPDWRVLAQGIVAMMAVAGLFNTSLLYTHEGKVYTVMAGVVFAALPRRRATPSTPESV
jgi:O-antigen ligase